MALAQSKRPATELIGAEAKRLRSDGLSPLSTADDDYEYDDEETSEPQAVDTPITPFSPARRFPSDEKTIRCTYGGCTKTFNRPARLLSHLRSHTNERPFVCSYAGCDKTYLEEKHLKQHIKGSHTHEREYQCDWDGCNKSFLTATRLRRHKEAHEGRERFRCTDYPPCNQTFRKHQTLQRHVRSEHLKLTPFPCTLIDADTQKPCTAGFDSSGSLRKHQDRTHGEIRFWCEECLEGGDAASAGFTTKAQLQTHVKTEHASCIFCEHRFSRASDLQKHLDTQHSGKSLADRKAFPCAAPTCTKAFTKKCNLDAHVRAAHHGHRFVCGSLGVVTAADLASWAAADACGRAFVSKANLEDHIRTQHLRLPSVLNAKRTKRPPRAKEPLHPHETSALDDLLGDAVPQPARTIPCTVTGCDWKFTRDYYLQNHLRTKHPEVMSTDAASTDFMPGPMDVAPGPEPSLDGILDGAGLAWEGALGGSETPFWVGGMGGDGNASGGFAADQDTWLCEELEMRQLIDAEGEGGIGGAELDALVDPVLHAMP